MERQTHDHTFPPFVRPDSKFLILGSFPSVKSREANFYYGHPQNRFWKILAALFNDELPTNTEEKADFLERHQIALYDTIESCSIIGSSDSSIADVVPADLAPILSKSQIGDCIFVNGGTSYKYYMKYIYPTNQIEPVKLPSSSPANAAWSLDRLIKEWGALLGI